MPEDTVQDPAINEPVAEDSNVTTSPVDETTTSEPTSDEGQAEQAPINEPAAEESQEDSERKPTRAERRIHQLTDRIEQLQQPNPLLQNQQSPQFPQYQPGEEITPDRLQQDVVQTAAQIANMIVDEKLAKQTATSNFQQDMVNVERDYPELAQVPEIEQAIVDEFQARAFRVVGFDGAGQPITRVDPSVRLADIAKKHVEGARALAQKTSAEMKNAVAMTADTSAVKPTGSVREEKPFKEKSIAEMERELGFVQM